MMTTMMMMMMIAMTMAMTVMVMMMMMIDGDGDGDDDEDDDDDDCDDDDGDDDDDDDDDGGVLMLDHDAIFFQERDAFETQWGDELVRCCAAWSFFVKSTCAQVNSILWVGEFPFLLKYHQILNCFSYLSILILCSSIFYLNPLAPHLKLLQAKECRSAWWAISTTKRRWAGEDGDGISIHIWVNSSKL